MHLKKVMRYLVNAALLGTPLLLAVLASPSCISIPEKPYVLSHREGADPASRAALCGEEQPGDPALAGGAREEGVDPEGFTLFSWNTKKGDRDGWAEDFLSLAAGADLVTLQEAWLTQDLLRLLEKKRYQWDMSAAFLSRARETGVLTGSTTAPDFVCAARYSEPLVLIPKTFLVSRYPLAGTGEDLLVANVHLINFTVDTEEYEEQLRVLERSLSSHEGPLLMAGDFNTWSKERSAAVHALAERLDLREVGFAPEDLASFFGRTVDHVFYRGLEAVEARAVRVVSSDHNPLLVTFRVPGEGHRR